MSVQTAYDLAVAWYQDRMKIDWDPFTTEQAEAVFRSFGLTDRFWQLA